jgi:hypothetical protein
VIRATPRAIFLTALWVALLSLSGCAALEKGVPALTVIDAVGRGLSQVLGWCEKRGIDPTTVRDAEQAVAEKDYGRAVELAASLVEKSRAAGDPVPEDVEVVLRLAEGAIAAQAVQEGMSAISKPAP